MINVFNEPSKYLEEIKTIKIPEETMNNKKAEHSGKTMLCSWITKLCPAKCSACFFKSNMYKDKTGPQEQYELSDVGVDNLIKFINDSNNAYLMLSGGGEPMIRPDVVNKIIRNTITERIVIVTSGIWANTYENAQKYIDQLNDSVEARNDDTTIVLRLSIDEFHYTSPSIKQANYENIINVFRNKYKDNNKFILRVHTMQDDPTLENVINDMGGIVKYENINGITDNNEIIKIVPKRAYIEYPDGYKIFVGLSKLFYANIKSDIRISNEEVKKALDVFEKDMKVSEYGNPSIVTNCNGLQGIDLWSDYNGNVTTWGSQQPDDLHSFYSSTYEEMMNDVYNNIQTYSFLDKGYYYRRNIIRDVNPRAVLRSEVMNLRDYAGAFIIEENDTQLYYAIRAIKDYLKEEVLSIDDILGISPELYQIITFDENRINEIYKNSIYDILVQYINNINKYTKEDWEDLFILIRLGHYEVHNENLLIAIKYYNDTYHQNITSIEDIKDTNDEAQLARLHNRISPMEPKVYEICMKNNEERRLTKSL